MRAPGEEIKTVRLKKKEDRRIVRGHPWVFSNEVGSGLAGVDPGELVEVADYSGRPVGLGYANPHTLIAVRMLARRGGFGPAEMQQRVARARSLRERFCAGRSSYRAVYSESDLLPGLIVDRYGDWLCVQPLTAGMERMLPMALDALVEVYRPAGIVIRADSPQRSLEGLDGYVRVERGDWPGSVTVGMAGLKLGVDLVRGQKTGFFLDQVDNYPLLDSVAPGADVLDLFCHSGPWSLYAAAHGAKRTVGVDSSAAALDSARDNARANGIGTAEFLKADAFDALKGMAAGGESFGTVVCDPPAFIKSRSKIAEGMRGYRDLNAKAMRVVAQGGFLISCSCSHHLDRQGFLDVLRASAAAAGRAARLVEVRSQSRDHPVLLAAPETEYLKCALVQLD